MNALAIERDTSIIINNININKDNNYNNSSFDYDINKNNTIKPYMDSNTEKKIDKHLFDPAKSQSPKNWESRLKYRLNKYNETKMISLIL
tara:strand:+ start:4220 stop:4489 length:270 start_codon:yes stop_codon:yes gene_type:complete